MPHCQICLSPVPHHANDCPVKTGEPVMGMNAEAAIQQAIAHDQAQLLQSGMMGAGRFHAATHQHDPAAIELRIEWLEKEVHLLRARIAKLERAP